MRFQNRRPKCQGRRPEFELQEIPRSGHFVPMEQPQACARVILTFLQKQKGPVKDKK